MRFTFDPDSNAVYLRIHIGTVYDTIELTDSVYLDVDASGLVLGVEFLNARDLTEIVTQRDAVLDIPERIDLVDPE